MTGARVMALGFHRETGKMEGKDCASSKIHGSLSLLIFSHPSMDMVIL
jgi:hypothetical protein